MVCVCSSEKGLLLSSACAGWDDDDVVCVCSSEKDILHHRQRVQGAHDDDDVVTPVSVVQTGVTSLIVPACTGWDDDVVTPVSVVRQGLLLSSACAGYT